MTTATVPEVVTPPPKGRGDYSWLATAVKALEPGVGITLDPVDWSVYQAVLTARNEWSRKVFIWYHRGSLVIMPTAGRHERWKKLLARLLEMIAFARGVPLVAYGNMTIAREDVDTGLEPDECYYVQRAAQVLADRELDFTADPPPDLAIEVENTRRLGGKTDIYAALGIPELWRFDGTRLRFFRLTAEREYAEITYSLAFPWLTADLSAFLARVGTIDDTALCRELYDWVQATHPAPQA
jgi:Uma2 family endonuclease